VNNAGFGTSGPFVERDLLRELAMVQVNVAALVHLTRLLLPPMVARRSGHILNLGSTAGFMPGPFMSVYYATKAFVNSFTEALAFELRGDGGVRGRRPRLSRDDGGKNDRHPGPAQQALILQAQRVSSHRLSRVVAGRLNQPERLLSVRKPSEK
jgi:NADP-dependent 3-hydroxy acid dehydrogenase YdfG